MRGAGLPSLSVKDAFSGQRLLRMHLLQGDGMSNNPLAQAAKQWYYVDASNQPIGPYSIAELGQFEAGGYITQETWVLKEGEQEYQKWAQISQLQVGGHSRTPTAMDPNAQYYVVDAASGQPVGPYPSANMYEMYMAQQITSDQSCCKVGDSAYITVYDLMVSWGYA